MSDIKSIEKAVASLPPAELAKFRQWFAGFDGAAWDRQIERDAQWGALDHLAMKFHASAA
jgi:hypothetical protein